MRCLEASPSFLMNNNQLLPLFHMFKAQIHEKHHSSTVSLVLSSILLQSSWQNQDRMKTRSFIRNIENLWSCFINSMSNDPYNIVSKRRKLEIA